MCMEFPDCLKRERDISIKPMFSGGKTTYRYQCNPEDSTHLRRIFSILPDLPLEVALSPAEKFHFQQNPKVIFLVSRVTLWR